MLTQLVHAKEKATLTTMGEHNTSQKIDEMKFKIPRFWMHSKFVV